MSICQSVFLGLVLHVRSNKQDLGIAYFLKSSLTRINRRPVVKPANFIDDGSHPHSFLTTKDTKSTKKI